MFKRQLDFLRYSLRLVICLVVIACAQVAVAAVDKAQFHRIETVLRQHIPAISADEFGGRAPNSDGGRKTIAYIQNQFKEAGLLPGNKGSWFQDVPLVSIDLMEDPELSFAGDGLSFNYQQPQEIVLFSSRLIKRVELTNSDLVFAGYGIVAPEYGWDDYQGLDVKGKTVVVLVNDPGYATQDPELFKGNAMTYYGRWTYKIEEATRQGAAAVLIVHESGAAGYG